MKNYSKYIIFSLLVHSLFVWVEYNRPKPIDFKTTYSNQDMNPFGSKILYELLPTVFKGQAIKALRVSIYNQLTENKLPTKGNYIFVGNLFGLKTNILDDSFIKSLSAKSGISIDEVSSLVAELNELATRGAIAESTLWRINEKIKDFYAKA